MNPIVEDISKDKMNIIESVVIDDYYSFNAFNEWFLIHIPTISIFKTTEMTNLFFTTLLETRSYKKSIALLSKNYKKNEVHEFIENIINLKSYINGIETDRITTKQALDSLLHHCPRGLMLFVTTACNLKCKYCYEKDELKYTNPQNLSKTNIDKIIINFFKKSGERRDLRITFFGGEPFLNFPLIKHGVEFSKKLAKKLGKEISFSVTTNGTLLTPRISDFLVKHSFSVMLSLDGDKDNNDQYRRFINGSGSYDVVHRNAQYLLKKQLKNKKLPLMIRCTMTSNNKDMDKLYEFFSSEFIGARIMLGESTGTAECSNIWDVPLPTTKEQDGIVFELAENLEEKINKSPYQYEGLIDSLGILHEKIQYGSFNDGMCYMCGLGRNMLAVSSNGNMYPCHRFVGNNKFIIGNIETDVHKDKLEKLYSQLIENYKTYCTKCWARNFCGGDCPAYLAKEDGSFSPPNKKRCDSLCHMYQNKIWLYFKMQEQNPEFINKHFN